MSAATMETGLSEFVKPKVVEKVFTLPLVTDTYDSLTKLSTPLYSYVEKAGAIASPIVDCAFTVKAGIENKMPEMLQTGITSAKGKVQFLLLQTSFETVPSNPTR